MLAGKDFIPVLLLGAVGFLGRAGFGIAEVEGEVVDWINIITQLGALGLLAVYLAWSVKERAAERLSRNEEERSLREMHLAQIKAIADSHQESLAQTIASLQRAYERKEE